MKPIIALVPLFDEEKDSLWMLPGYMNCLYEAGAIALMLPLTLSSQDIKQVLQHIDGIVMTGGHDVHPSLYHEDNITLCGELCQQRDILESALYPLALEKNIPILGICRGFQLINVLQGGHLYQDLPQQFPSFIEHDMDSPYDRPIHQVTINHNSPLYQLLHQETIEVNSCHHQGIKTLGQDLKAMATSPDRLIEALYHTQHPFIWGVQWHPEFIYQKDQVSQKIIKAFVEACQNQGD